MEDKMKFEEEMDLIGELSGQGAYLSTPRFYIEYTEGNVNEALVINQLIFWSRRTKNEEKWFYKSYDDWKKEVYLSKCQMSNIIKKFIKLGIVETKIKKANGNPTVHYRLKSDVLYKQLKEANLRLKKKNSVSKKI